MTRFLLPAPGRRAWRPAFLHAVLRPGARRRWAFAGSLLAATVATACRSATGQDSVYPSLTAVYGRVLRADRTPVVGVFVTALGYPPPCGASPSGTPHAEGSPPYVTTDSAGSYRLVLNTPRQEVLCIVVRAGTTGAALAGPTGALAEARVDSVPFRMLDAQGGARTVRDSVRIDLAVP